MAILLQEPDAIRCREVLQNEPELVLSAGTLSEAFLVAIVHDRAEELAALIEGLPFEIVDVTAASARRVGEAYRHWGKGRHRAALNFGDCFAYELASHRGCPLLFIGNDFARTDIESAI
jgi:ribonuclease VapC